MKLSKNVSTDIIRRASCLAGGVSLALVMICLAFGTANGADLLPEGFAYADTFEPGLGSMVGSVKLAQGEVVIIHGNAPLVGYKAEKDMALYKNDTVITLKGGKIFLVMNDESTMTLASNTRLTINESLYDPDKTKSRTSFLSMTMGRARFLVRELTGYKRSEFKVKTQTAIVGVRGSDFIVEAEEESTRVTALANTRLEVVSLFVPCQGDRKDCKVESALLTDFEQAVVAEEALPSVIEGLMADEIEKMMEDFAVRTDGDGVLLETPEPEAEPEDGDAAPPREKRDMETDARDGTEPEPRGDRVLDFDDDMGPEMMDGPDGQTDGPPVDGERPEPPPPRPGEDGIRVEVDDLPEMLEGPEPFAPDAPDPLEPDRDQREDPRRIPEMTDVTEAVHEDRQEDVLEERLQELPSFPGAP